MAIAAFQKIRDLQDIIPNLEGLVIEPLMSGSLAAFVPSLNGQSLIFEREERAGFASFPRTTTSDEYSSQIISISPSGESVVKIAGTKLAVPGFDFFPSGDVLIYGARSRYSQETGPEKNCAIFSVAGEQLAELSLGDGINDVQIDSLGRIWVSYFDEGVYGNFGWGSDGLKLGPSGLLCMNAEGAVLYRQNRERPAGSGEHQFCIDDCYALNVSYENVGFFAYSDFFLGTLSPKFEEDYWYPELSGCGLFACYKDDYHFGPQYGEEFGLWHVKRGQPESKKWLDLKDMGIPRTSGSIRMFARGPYVHVLQGSTWYRFNLSE